jgi:hypothetical protein
MIAMEQILAILMALGLIAFGAFTGLQAFTTLREQLRAWNGASKSRAWPATSGVIEQSELTWRGIRGPRARPLVSYRYQVDGKSYVGQRVNFSFARIYYTPEAQAVLDRYLARAQVSVYYDPEHPAESTLEQRHDSVAGGVFVGLMLLFPTLLCLAGGLIGLAQTFGK